MPAAQFKEQCLAMLDRVDPEGLVITKHGKPVAKLTPLAGPCDDLIGSLKGKITIAGDILSTGIQWDFDASGGRLFHGSAGAKSLRRKKC